MKAKRSSKMWSLTNCLLILQPCPLSSWNICIKCSILCNFRSSKWSKTSIADGKLFQEQCLKIWQENYSELLGHYSDARGFFTGKNNHFIFYRFFYRLIYRFFLPVKNTSVYVTLTMLIKYSVHCRVQCTALLEMS